MYSVYSLFANGIGHKCIKFSKRPENKDDKRNICCTHRRHFIDSLYSHTRQNRLYRNNWICYLWETSAISGSVRMHRGKAPHHLKWPYGGVLWRSYYAKAWNSDKQPLVIDIPVNIERHAQRINQFASLNLCFW